MASDARGKLRRAIVVPGMAVGFFACQALLDEDSRVGQPSGETDASADGTVTDGSGTDGPTPEAGAPADVGPADVTSDGNACQTYLLELLDGGLQLERTGDATAELFTDASPPLWLLVTPVQPIEDGSDSAYLKANYYAHWSDFSRITLGAGVLVGKNLVETTVLALTYGDGGAGQTSGVLARTVGGSAFLAYKRGAASGQAEASSTFDADVPHMVHLTLVRTADGGRELWSRIDDASATTGPLPAVPADDNPILFVAGINESNGFASMAISGLSLELCR